MEEHASVTIFKYLIVHISKFIACMWQSTIFDNLLLNKYFTEHLVYVRHYFRLWEYICEQNKLLSLHSTKGNRY